MTDVCAVADENCKGTLVRHHDNYTTNETRLLCRRHHALWHRDNGHAPGWNPTNTTGTPIKFYLPHETAAELRRAAREEERTVSSIIRRLMREYIERHEAAA